MSRFDGTIMYYFEKVLSFIRIYIHKALMVQDVYETWSLKALGVEST